MARFVLVLFCIWTPLFMLFLNHRQWRWSVAKSAFMALGWASLAAVVSAVVLAMIAVLFP
jgi:hypothetical protein